MPSQFPFGDAFVYSSPETDRASNFLLQEQTKRQQQKQIQDKALDDLMNKEFYKAKSIDQPGLLQKYQNYKSIKQQLYRNPNLDAQSYNEINQKANEALADVFYTNTKSVEQKKLWEELIQESKEDHNH